MRSPSVCIIEKFRPKKKKKEKEIAPQHIIPWVISLIYVYYQSNPCTHKMCVISFIFLAISYYAH